MAVDKFLTGFLKSRFAPYALRPLTLLFIVPLTIGLLFGPDAPDSFFNLIVWLLWWPMIILLFLFAGRVWCGVCPFTQLGDWAQRATGVRRAVPDFLKEHGSWLTLLMFFWLLWLEEVLNAPHSPRGTAVVILTIATGALFFGLFFRGHTWCRYMCPLGGVSFAYARTSLFKVRNNDSICGECATKACVVVDADYAGCPMHVTPFAINTIANCKFCGTCVQRCSYDSLHVAFEAPSADLAGQSASTPAVPWFIVLLTGMVSFLNLTTSGNLPAVTALLHASTWPVLLKTGLIAAAMAAAALLFRLIARLAHAAGNEAPREHLLIVGTLPLIPLLLLTHLGYFIGRTLTQGGMLLAPLSRLIGWVWPASGHAAAQSWAGYAAPLLIVTGLALSLFVLRWMLARESGMNTKRAALSFGLFYLLVAGWNLFLTWPAGPAAGQSLAAAGLHRPPLDGGTILWLFAGVNAVAVILAIIARRAQAHSGAAEAPADFSASRSWTLQSRSRGKEMDYFDWLLDQAMHARLNMPAVIALANSCQEVITFLQRKLPAGSTITVKAVLRKNKAIMTIIHEGRPLTLPNFKTLTSLEEADDSAMDGLELRLAAAYVEHMSYLAHISSSTCSFTLRQSC